MSATEAERLAREFFARVWAPPHDLDAIDDLMTEDYRKPDMQAPAERATTKLPAGACHRAGLGRP